jgi:hypothetical protein
VLQHIEEDAPATFLYAPAFVYAVHRRYRGVTMNPQSAWITLHKWSVSTEAVSRRSQ